jgi:hypothetical protein
VYRCASSVEREREGLKHRFYSAREEEGTPAGEATLDEGKRKEH